MRQTSILISLISITLALPASLNAAELGGDFTTRLCPTGLDIPARPLVEVELDEDDTFATADEADLIEKGVSELKGNAEVTRNTQQVRADKIIYDEPADTADLEGDVHYWDDALFLQSNDAFLTFDNGTGEFDKADYILIDSRGRGQADQLLLDVGTRTEMDNVRYTTCDPDDEFWHFTASRLELDHENNWGTARNFVLRIKDFPVFYTPYMSFPLSKERKSGFLAPTYGNTNRHGFQLETPYYVNIAPNMDATVAPRLFTDSGVMAVGEFRYMFGQGEGQVNLEYLPSDNLRDDEHRNFVHFDHEQTFFDRGRLTIDYNRVSDKFYFEDFGGQIGVTSTRFLDQRADASYGNSSFGHNWNLRTRIQNYQVVDRSIPVSSRPYKRLPQVLFNVNSPRRYGSVNYGMQTESVYFERDDDLVFASSNDNINGLRVKLEPYVSYPMRTVATYLEPKLSLDYTQYHLDDSSLFTKSPSRVLPKFSVDGGVFLERETQLFNRGLIQTLEPKIYYLYVPRENQSDLPVFDTGLYSFDFNSLFRDNRFSGNDRQTDANQVTLAVSSHFIDQETGRDLGNISVGQIFYFADRTVRLPGTSIRDEDSSALVAEINARMIRHWEFGGDIVWDPNVSDKTEKLGLRATYNPAPGKVINMSYRVRRDATDIEQSDISVHWPINNKWSVVGRWNYAVPEGRSLETFAGVEYESCCWAARAVARRYLTDIDGDFQTGIFFQVELKGLAGIGKKTVDFLKQQIPGYQSEF
ncbi:MAG: LPS assembly protein LptD [Pseudomonadota bacterium]